MRSHSAHCSSRSWESGSLHGLRCRAACAARMRAATHRWVDLGVEAGAITRRNPQIGKDGTLKGKFADMFAD